MSVSGDQAKFSLIGAQKCELVRVGGGRNEAFSHELFCSAATSRLSGLRKSYRRRSKR